MSNPLSGTIKNHVENMLEKKLKGYTQSCPFDRIDIQTEHYIIEIKKWEEHKKAIGQILGYSVYYKNHQKRIDTFYEKNGYMPEGADAQKIYDETKSLRSSIQLANNGVIFYSNRLVIGKLLKGFPSASIIAKTIGEESTRTLEKVLAADVLTKGALKFGENTFGKKAAKCIFS